jgi:uncharacterized coiled-coil DUF342 family protein
MGTEIISLLSFIQSAPSVFTAFIGLVVLSVAIYLKVKDKNIVEATSVAKIQNDSLAALMNQNNSLLESVESLQGQLKTMSDKMVTDSEDHRKKMDEMYKVTDDMRKRIMELEDLVRKYQYQCDTCAYKPK